MGFEEKQKFCFKLEGRDGKKKVDAMRSRESWRLETPPCKPNQEPDGMANCTTVVD